MKTLSRISPCVLVLLILIGSICQGQTTQPVSSSKPAGALASAGSFEEGKDYFLFERVRLMDNVGFSQPAEAYSMLLPKGWKQQSAVEWTAPGQTCAGTNKWLNARSPDGTMSLTMNPMLSYNWPQLPFQGNTRETYCGTSRPFDAETYLRKIYGPNGLGNPEIISVKSNEAVVQEMMVGSEEARKELMGYGSTQLNFYPSAINAKVRWADGSEALLIIGVTVTEGVVPNPYNGTSTTIYTTVVAKCDVFKYPAAQAEEAEKIFVTIMGSFRTNPAWSQAVKGYWKDARQQGHIAHLGTIKMIDDQTRAIGNQAIANGQARLNNMDNQMRSWEQSQASIDRMNTNFVKTIREVEYYRDETGKVEMASGYNHAWSRSDGTTFLLSNDPNFDPAALNLDYAWKEMKKVD